MSEHKNADEIVRALRCDGNADTKKPDCEHCPLLSRRMCVKAMLEGAADLIESLQAQLAETQRQLQAAVKDLNLASDCSTCDVRGKRGFSSCAPLFVGDEGSCKNYKWRGPQEAVKGEPHETETV